jgi:hypothetical protein
MHYSEYIGKTVTFTENVETLEPVFDAGMKAVITAVKPVDTDLGDLQEHLYLFEFDFTPYGAYNETKMKANFYDNKGFPCLTAKQAGYLINSETLYFGAPELHPFENYMIVEG